MSLQRMDTLMRRAREQKIAIGAFECWESLNIQAIAKAAAYCRKPVIFQASPAEYNTMGGADALACMVKFYVNKYDIDAALHLDHGSTLEHVEECVKSGFTSVMLDASAEVFAENVRLSAAAAQIAHSANCSLEAELGHVTGGDGGDAESALTVPEEVVEFVKQTNVDCLAVSIGTVHGDYRGKPELRLDLLKKITDLTDIPLVLHGGSGTPIIDAIRQLLYSHGLTEITFPEEQDDPVWVIWFDNNADPFECKVTGIQVTNNSMTVVSHEKEANFEATCHTPFELGASNIDWLQQMYDAVWQQLEENRDNNA